MDEYKELINQAGWGGISLYLLGKYGHLWWKKANGKYISWESLEKVNVRITKICADQEKINDLSLIYNQHLRDSTQRVVDLETLKKDNSLNNEFIKDRVTRIENNMDKMFALISDIKNIMIEKGVR